MKFYKIDGSEWVGNFKPGFTGLKTVIELLESSILLVISFGTCYLMNQEQQKPLSVFGCDYSDYVKADNGRIILQGQTNLTIIEPDGSRWDTERISIDGLKELKLENNIVTGLAFNPLDDYEIWKWEPYSYNIETRILSGGSYLKPNVPKKRKWWF